VQVVQAIVLGIVQGIAEFLPISSSGHLVLVPAILGWEDFAGNLAFNVLVHAASLTAVVTYFRHDLWQMVLAFFSRTQERATDRKLAWLIIAGTFVTGSIALLFNDFFESLFEAPIYAGGFLIVTAVILTSAEKLTHVRTDRAEDMNLRQALFVGLAQAVAIMPGISRAGATISAGLAAGLTRAQAARFSFLLSTPIILLATIKELYDAVTHGSSLPSLWACIAGFIAAAVSSYFAIAWLLAYLRNRSLYPFAVYTAILGTIIIIWQVAL
jgi:undecaprenyl-diphosphatase